MPTKYFFTVNSKPTGVSPAIWEKWYTSEHIPDVVSSGSATRGALYKETHDVPSLYEYNAEKPYSRNYMAIYHTEYEELMKNPGFGKIRGDSDFFPEGRRGSMENGDFDIRNYSLIDVFEPSGKEVKDVPAPVILWAELEYPGSEAHLKSFYNEEHFPLLGKVKGYRRGLRYKIGPDSPLMPSKPAKFLAIHEWDSEHGMERTPEMDAVTQTEWTMKVMGDVKFSVIRTFELVQAFGYDEKEKASI